MNSLPAPLLVAILSFAVSGFCFYAWYQASTLARAIKSTPTTAIAKATTGYREFQGTAHNSSETPLKDPVSQKECVWYHIETQQLQDVIEEGADNKQTTRHRWVTINTAESNRPIMLRDASGHCLLDVYGAQFVTSGTETVWAEKKLLKGYTMRHNIKRIRENQALYALGMYVRSASGSSGQMRAPGGEDPYLISTMLERQLLTYETLKASFSRIIGIVGTVVGIASLIAWVGH